MSQLTESNLKRRSIHNFVLMPNLQWPYIMRILAIVNLSGILLACTIFTVFYFRFHAHTLVEGLEDSGATSQGMIDALVQENLMDVVAPVFVIVDVISLIIGLWLSLYFSRKLSIPIYRVKQWAETVASGDLTYRLKFRPKDNLQGLEEACNQVTETYALIIEDLRRQITEANIPLSKSSIPIKTRIQKSLP